jgi:hypothetical protein
VAAFADLGRALRPARRLVMTVWQAREHNMWDVAIRRSLQAAEGPAAGAPDRPARGPPSVREILQAAVFADIAFTDVRGPVCYGAAALDRVHGFTCTRAALKRLDPAAATRADERLRQALAEHLRDDGVWFDSHAWIITARRR